MEPDLQNNTNILSEGTNRLYLDLKQHNHLDFTSNTTRTLKVLECISNPADADGHAGLQEESGTQNPHC